MLQGGRHRRRKPVERGEQGRSAGHRRRELPPPWFGARRRSSASVKSWRFGARRRNSAGSRALAPPPRKGLRLSSRPSPSAVVGGELASTSASAPALLLLRFRAPQTAMRREWPLGGCARNRAAPRAGASGSPPLRSKGCRRILDWELVELVRPKPWSPRSLAAGRLARFARAPGHVRRCRLPEELRPHVVAAANPENLRPHERHPTTVDSDPNLH
jgi:hypothetical protein